MDIPLHVEEGKDDILRHLITQEVNYMRDNIKRALKQELQKGTEKQKKSICLSKVQEYTKPYKIACKFCKEIKFRTQGQAEIPDDEFFSNKVKLLPL